MSSTRPTPDVARAKTQHSAWIALVVTGLIIGSAFIAVYVGLQRDPVPLHLPVAVVGQQLASTTQAGLGDKVRVTEVASIDDGSALVRDGEAVAVVGATSPTAPPARLRRRPGVE